MHVVKYSSVNFFLFTTNFILVNHTKQMKKVYNTPQWKRLSHQINKTDTALNLIAF